MVYGGGLVCSSYINIDQSAVSYGLAAIFIWFFQSAMQSSRSLHCSLVFFYNGGFGWAAKINFCWPGLWVGFWYIASYIIDRSAFIPFIYSLLKYTSIFLVIRWANVYPSFPGSERKYLNYKYLNCVGLGYIPLTIQVSILCTLLGQKDNVKLTSTLYDTAHYTFCRKSYTLGTHTHGALTVKIDEK